jgi:uncharacterized protein (TIGR02001 family)
MKISTSKVFASALVAIMFSVFSTSNSKAAEALKIGPAEISFNAGFMSAYQWRGEDQNNGDSTASFGADVALPANIYIGTWTASASGSSSQEVDLYAGIAPTYGDFGFDLGYIAYIYPGATDTGAINFGEFYIGASYAPEKASYSLGVKYSKNDDSGTCAVGVWESCSNIEYSASYDILSITYGDYDKQRTYTTVALTKEYGGIEFSAAYTSSDWESGLTPTNRKDDFFVISASKSF